MVVFFNMNSSFVKFMDGSPTFQLDDSESKPWKLDDPLLR